MLQDSASFDPSDDRLIDSDEVGCASRLRRSFVVAGLGAIAGFAAQAKAVNTAIVLGRVALSFYAVTGAVVQEVLERLGHRVEVKEGPHEQMFPLLAQGSVDLMAAAWLPEGHRLYWDRFGTNAVEVATLYEGARFFWAVPVFVPQTAVGSIGDLAKPEAVEHMSKQIQGIGRGATISVFSERAIAAYGLAQHGYTFRPGDQKEWIGAYQAAVSEKRWIIFPTWTPQYLNRDGALRTLDDPLGMLGGVNRASLVAPRARFNALPETTRNILSRIKIGIEGVTEMDRLVNVNRKSPTEAAREWMRHNTHRVDSWFGA